MSVFRVFPGAFWLIILYVSSMSFSVNAETIEVDVQGLTCAFCVDSLQRKLKKLPDIVQVDVSLKSKKVRIVSTKEKADIALIKKAIIDSGFTPATITQIQDD